MNYYKSPFHATMPDVEADSVLEKVQPLIDNQPSSLFAIDLVDEIVIELIKNINETRNEL